MGRRMMRRVLRPNLSARRRSQTARHCRPALPVALLAEELLSSNPPLHLLPCLRAASSDHLPAARRRR
eukprot:5042805-Alexandrium_andersonii.AAC.1